jgi:hypothetical protein
VSENVILLKGGNKLNLVLPTTKLQQQPLCQ